MVPVAPQRWPQPGKACRERQKADQGLSRGQTNSRRLKVERRDELTKLTDILHGVCPSDAVITFEFAGALHVHIDVRTLEDMTRLETLIPSLAGGAFYDIQRGLAARRSFFHRLSASVAR